MLVINKRRVLITGGAGAIGSACARFLSQHDYEVLVLDDLSSGHEKLLPPGVRFVKGSVTSDADLKTCFEFKPHDVIHMAALFANQNSIDHPVEDLMTNGLGTLNVLMHSQRQKVDKVVYISSSCVYGNKALMDESDTDLHPDTPYAVTKLLGEKYCKVWAQNYGLNTVSLRFFNSYGPGEYPGAYRNVVPNFFKLALEKKSLVITGTGKETRDFNYVDDTVRGVVGALQGKTAPGDVFNIASGRETTVLEVATIVNELTRNPSPIVFAERRSWDTVLHRRGSIQRAAAAFGYEPKVSLRDGLRLTYEWLSTRAPF